VPAVRERGAHEVIEYSHQDLRNAIRHLTDGRGVDVFFDNVGGEVFDALSRLMNWGGRILPIGFTSGTIPTLAMNLPLLKNYSVVGCFWGAHAAHDPAASRVADERLVAWVASGELRPLIDEVLPLERISEALTKVLNRQTIGRVVLAIR
jgi:NADPH2:quinone reductase